MPDTNFSRRPVILFADDEDAIRGLFIPVLETHGYETHEASNGFEALAEAHRSAPDLVVMDLVMPKCEGIQTIMQLRKSYPKLKIIAISGACAGAYLSTAKHLGADDILAKPFSPSDLLTAIRSQLPATFSAVA